MAKTFFKLGLCDEISPNLVTLVIIFVDDVVVVVQCHHSGLIS